jgi:hypothetical protein
MDFFIIINICIAINFDLHNVSFKRYTTMCFRSRPYALWLIPIVNDYYFCLK